jgi:RHS repeat-associated protein
MFTGRQLDEEAGIYFYRARYYDALKGRFLQRDPLDYESGINLFEYAKSSPTNRVDPSGEADGGTGSGSGSGGGSTGDKKKCCCCCATDLNIPQGEVSQYKPTSNAVGNFFRAWVTLQYKEWDKPCDDCQLEYWEYNDYVSDEEKTAGKKVNTWQDMRKLAPTAQGFGPWNTKKIPCPSEPTKVGIWDVPHGPKVVKGEKQTWSRTLYFLIRVTSSCPDCKVQEVYAVQKLEVKAGEGVGEQDFHSLDKLPDPPGLPGAGNKK